MIKNTGWLFAIEIWITDQSMHDSASHLQLLIHIHLRQTEAPFPPTHRNSKFSVFVRSGWQQRPCRRWHFCVQYFGLNSRTLWQPASSESGVANSTLWECLQRLRFISYNGEHRHVTSSCNSSIAVATVQRIKTSTSFICYTLNIIITLFYLLGITPTTNVLFSETARSDQTEALFSKFVAHLIIVGDTDAYPSSARLAAFAPLASLFQTVASGFGLGARWVVMVSRIEASCSH